jgi:uncharacterized membrane protein
MSNVIALVYPESHIADEVYNTVNRLQAMRLMDLIDASVALKAEDEVFLQQAHNLPLIGAANGIFLGALVGLFFAGAPQEDFAEVGLDTVFLQQLNAAVKPGNSVLFLYLRDAEVEMIEDEMSIHGGEILHTFLHVDQENRLQELFKMKNPTPPREQEVLL